MGEVREVKNNVLIYINSLTGDICQLKGWDMITCRDIVYLSKEKEVK